MCIYLSMNGSTNVPVFVYRWPSGDHSWLAESMDAELTDIECGLKDVGILGFCHQQLGTNPPPMLRDECVCVYVCVRERGMSLRERECVCVTEMKQLKKEKIK